jgi:hypothetical protein
MIPQKILDKLYDCMDCADLIGFEKQVKKYLLTTDEATASQALAMFIVTEYTAARADALAKLMEIIISCNPNLALIKHPENHFFRLCLIRGSMDLFECYMEEAIEPHLENSSQEEYKEYYTKLLHLGAKLNTLFTDQYEPQIKGLHFNGAFSDDGAGVVNINADDYETMNDIIDKYNTMVGRRDIIKALMTKVGMQL